MRDAHAADPYHAGMMTNEVPATRTLTLVLPEAEWRALRDIEPDALGWLQQRIRERLAAPATRSGASAAAPADVWDDY